MGGSVRLVTHNNKSKCENRLTWLASVRILFYFILYFIFHIFFFLFFFPFFVLNIIDEPV
jgi:uncharacterized membrane protein YdjX (TVP38/TMEM64 family)